MKYLLISIMGCVLFALLGSWAGLCFGLDFNKWAPWLVFLPCSIATIIAFVVVSYLIIKKM